MNGIVDESVRGVITMAMRGMTRYVVEFRAMVMVESRGRGREKVRWTRTGLAVKKGVWIEDISRKEEHSDADM